MIKPVSKGSHEFHELSKLVLTRIGDIKADLDPGLAFSLGPTTASKLLEVWPKLQRHVAAAKLAIVRDEFSIRFPSLSSETEDFTFGISDSLSDRYMLLLKLRNSNDILQVAFSIIHDIFGNTSERKLPGIGHFVSNLTKILQGYSQQTELSFEPFASVG